MLARFGELKVGASIWLVGLCACRSPVAARRRLRGLWLLPVGQWPSQTVACLGSWGAVGDAQNFRIKGVAMRFTLDCAATAAFLPGRTTLEHGWVATPCDTADLRSKFPKLSDTVGIHNRVCRLSHPSEDSTPVRVHQSPVRPAGSARTKVL